MLRFDKRKVHELRPVTITPHSNRYAEGSALIELGNTKVLCNASVENHLPKWLQNQNRGWVTAEYSMIPRSTHERIRRDKINTSGRTQEISRLIARSLRSCIDTYKLKDIQITVDCDVLQADGGTRTAAITGGFVALAQAIHHLLLRKQIHQNPLKNQVAAISVGLLESHPMLDLCYQEDNLAETDCNFVVNNQMGLVEIQGTAEENFFTRDQLSKMLDLAIQGCQTLHQIQKEALEPLGIKIDKKD